jgi:Na+-driven multidrug efflux pump
MSYAKSETSDFNFSSDDEGEHHEQTEDNSEVTALVNFNNEAELTNPTFCSTFKEVIYMSSAIVVTRVFFSLNSYGNSIILNTHDHHNSSDSAAAGALINTFNSMVFGSLFGVLASNYIKSIPMAIEKNYEEVRENLLRTSVIGVLILTPIGEIAFYFSENLFENVMRSGRCYCRSYSYGQYFR